MPSAGDTPDPDRPRFESCFRENYSQVLGFAMRRMAGRDLAEDAVAETFAVAWRKRELIPDPALPWLYAIAVRVIANQRRGIERRRALGERLAHAEPGGGGGFDPVDSLDRRDAFAAAFGRLSEQEREVLRLVGWDGLDNRDAARVLGCSPGAFRVRLHRARRRLEKQLQAAGHLSGDRRSIPDTAEEIS